jgi:hypothetical protein
MWKNMVQPDRPKDDNIVWRMCFACWITKAAETHSKYIILIAFPWQHWICKHASMVHYCTLPVLYMNEILPSYSQKHISIQHSHSSSSSQVDHIQSTRFKLDTWMLITNPAVSHTDHWGMVKLASNLHLLIYTPWDKTLFTASWSTSSTQSRAWQKEWL